MNLKTFPPHHFVYKSQTAAIARPSLVMRAVSRAQQLQRVATFGLLGGVAMFASGGSARCVC